jgi:hypothetical protein
LETTGNTRQIAIKHVKKYVEWDDAVGDKVLLRKVGILRKSESKYEKEPWTVSQVHTNGTIRIQCGTKSERLNTIEDEDDVDEFEDTRNGLEEEEDNNDE